MGAAQAETRLEPSSCTSPLDGQPTSFFLAIDFMRIFIKDRMEVLSIDCNCHRTSNEHAQYNIQKVMSIVLNSRKGDVGGQKKRQRTDEVQVHWLRSDIHRELQLAEQPHGQKQISRKRYQRVAGGSQSHPINKAKLPQRSGAHRDVHKNVSGRVSWSTASFQEIWSWPSNPVFQGICDYAIHTDGQGCSKQGHLQQVQRLVPILPMFGEAGDCHDYSGNNSC